MTAPVDDPRLKPLPQVSAWLSDQHAQAQESVANNLILGLFPLWQIMRFTELDASTKLWLPSVLPRVQTAFLQSQRLSAVFNANVRFAELPVEEPLLIEAPTVELPPDVPSWAFDMPQLENVNIDGEIEYAKSVAEAPGRPRHPVSGSTPQWVLDRIKLLEDLKAGRTQVPQVELQKFNRADVATSLTIEANYGTKRAMPGPEEELMHNALVRSSSAAVRQALKGGRGVTNEVMRKDRKVIGFARVTDANPCAFCALLASRGAVYGKGAFARSDAKRESDRSNPKTTWAKNPEAARDVPDGWTNVAKVHNNCKCQLRPVYSNESVWDAAAKHFLKLWDDRWKNPEQSKQETIEDVLKRNPKMSGYNLSRAIDLRAFQKKLEKNPFPGNQFDLNQMKNDLSDRVDGYLDAGFSPSSPQVQWAEQTAVLLDQ